MVLLCSHRLVLRSCTGVSHFLAEMVLVPELSLGVVVLINVGNGLVPPVVKEVSRLASDVVRVLLGIPLPRRRFSRLRFSAALDVTLKALTLYQGWSRLRRLGGSAGHGHSAVGLASRGSGGMRSHSFPVAPSRFSMRAFSRITSLCA
ncbi:MAG: hypothetical protein E6J34_00035 [Chloroflexi bacterium]|nr:MAG: hypothetical protein E6J34_00035 [Chloroflexota bacterium]